MVAEKTFLKTITKVFKFKDEDGEVYRFLRSGGKTCEAMVKFKKRFVNKSMVEGNVFLNEGLEFIWKAVTGVTGLTYFDSSHAHIGVGDSSTAEDPSQTGLLGANKYYKLVDSGYPVVEGNRVIFRATFGGDEANFAWNEWTVANGAGDGYVNLNRKVQSLGTKTSGTTWVLEVELSIS